MATDYDTPRKTDDDVNEDSIEELKARRNDKSASAVDVDEFEQAEGLELPGADLSNEELAVRVLPKQQDEFTCMSCFLVHHRSQLAAEERTASRSAATARPEAGRAVAGVNPFRKRAPKGVEGVGGRRTITRAKPRPCPPTRPPFAAERTTGASPWGRSRSTSRSGQGPHGLARGHGRPRCRKSGGRVRAGLAVTRRPDHRHRPADPGPRPRHPARAVPRTDPRGAGRQARRGRRQGAPPPSARASARQRCCPYRPPCRPSWPPRSPASPRSR